MLDSQSWVSAMVVVFACSGCYATASTQPVTSPQPVTGPQPVVEAAPPAETADVEVTAATIPVDITTYPSTVYEGRTVYFWGGRSYYRNGNNWAYYRQEPEGLRRQRATVQAAPPARHEERRDEPHEEHHEGRR